MSDTIWYNAADFFRYLFPPKIAEGSNRRIYRIIKESEMAGFIYSGTTDITLQ
jgi:hypothetical protein